MKKVFFSLLILAIGFGANAQKAGGLQFGLGANAGLPVSGAWKGSNLQFKDVFPAYAGLDLALKYAIADQVALTADVAYNNFFNKKQYDLYRYRTIPVTGGLRFYPTQNLFLGANAGVSFNKYEFGSGTTAGNESNSTFAFGLGAGYVINNSFEIGLNYTGYSKKDAKLSTQVGSPQLSTVGLRLGYWFGNK